MSHFNLVTEYLQQHSIAYEVANFGEEYSMTQVMPTTLPVDQLAVTTLIQTTTDHLIVVFPAKNLLLMQHLTECLGTKIEGTSPRSFQIYADLPSDFCLPAFGSAYDLRVLVDASLQNYEIIYLFAGDETKLIKLSQAEFQKLFAKNQMRSLSMPIDLFKTITVETNGSISQLGLPRYHAESLLKVISDKHEFPVMSHTAKQILKIQADPNSEVKDLTHVVEESPSLAAQVVKWANSPYYGFPGEIKTIDDAIVKVLGFEMVLNLALGIAISHKFKIPETGPIGLKKYWQQSIYTAALLEQLVLFVPSAYRPSVGLAYLSGLLHNFGYLLMGESFPEHFKVCNQLIAVNPHLSHQQIEEIVLGMNHSELGGALMENWQMPTEIISVNRYHHSALTTISPENIMIALTAITLAGLKTEGFSDAASSYVPENYLELLKINENQIMDAMDNIIERQEQLNEISTQMAKS